MSTRTHHYFAYGSNLNREEMLVRCPTAKPFAPAILRDWRLTFRGVADIEPAGGSVVRGALWRLCDDDIRSLDRYEGAPSLYAQRLVTVETDSGPVDAMTYSMTSDDYLGLPSPWYFERIAQGYRDWKLPLKLLGSALNATRNTLADLGVSGFEADGRKRLRGIR